MITLNDLVIRNTSAVRRTDDELLDPDFFKANPLKYYKKVLERTYAYSQFKESERFVAIILREKIVTSDQIETFSNFKPFSEDIKPRFFNILIPDIDSHIPIPKDFNDFETINAFYNNSSRIAYYEDTDNIEPGYIVLVSDAIIADKNKVPCRIEKIHSKKKLKFEKIAKASEAIRSCVKQKLQTLPPDDVITSAPVVYGTFANQPSISIFSSQVFESLEKSVANSKISLDANSNSKSIVETPEFTDEDKKSKLLQKIIIKPNTILNECKLDEIIGPQDEKTEVEPKQDIENAFIKDNLALAEQKIEVPAGAKFYSFASSDPNSLKLKASDASNLSNPVVNLPVNSRNVKMIVVRDIPFLFTKDYHELITNEKIDAVHFAIDPDGTIYQFTDTKNLVRAFNPTIDEISIHIGILNINHRNSNSTKQLYESGVRLTYNSTLGSVLPSRIDNQTILRAQQNLNILGDKRKLINFLKGKTKIDRQEVPLENLTASENKKRNVLKLKLEDGREVFPPYRLDATEKQKQSLKELVKAIKLSYKIENNIPDILGFDPNVAAGDFSGIVSPMHFSYEQFDPINIKEKNYLGN